MRSLVALSITSLLVLAMVAPSDARAWCRMTTSERLPTTLDECIFPDTTTDPPEHYLAWTRPCSEIAFSADARSAHLSADEVMAVFTRSIATWEAVECGGTPLGMDLEIIPDPSTCTDPLYRDGAGNVNAIMFVADWGEREYDPAAFAVTTVWHRRSTGEILDVDMEINERQGPFGICPAEGCPEMETVDLENVVTHELGHYFGLAHSADPEATMYASAVAGETLKRDLSEDDIAGICEIYPPGTPTGECDFTPKGGLVLHCETGCAVSSPGAGGSSLWLLASALLLLRRRR
jgi:hypothetical protein